MSVFQGDCPHCQTKDVAFSIAGQVHAEKLPQNLWDTLATCGRCSRGVLATFNISTTGSPKQWLQSQTSVPGGAPTISPAPRSVAAPTHTPTNVAKFFEQGMDNMRGNWDAAGTMFRKALDVGLKVKFPDISPSLTLFRRIEQAEATEGLMPELAEWANQIRLDGNDAAHEDEPFSKEDAENLRTFTDLVLRYLFTLPGMLAEARGGSANGHED